LLAKGTDASARRGALAEGLSAVAGQLPPAEAAAVCRPAARLLAGALPKDASHRFQLAEHLSSLVGRLPPAEAAHLLAEALVKETDAQDRLVLAEALSAVAGRLPPAEGARLLTEALAKDRDFSACHSLAQCLVIITDRMERAEADRVCEQALRLVQQRDVSATAWEARMGFQRAVSVLLQQLAEENARSTALHQARQTAAAPDVNRGSPYPELPQVVILDRLLTDASPRQRRRGAVATATAVGLACGGPLPALAAWPSAAEPLACRLTTPELVELLKYPTCFGAARQVVLKHLGNRYGRTFANHWEFVRFAREHNLGLDFTSPPKRPGK
jgi:hypothetical protein